MKAANFAPTYFGLYPHLAELTRKHGYALAVHGTAARDFDLVCVPWTETASSPQEVVDDITNSFALKQQGEPEIKNHGRICYTIIVSFGECFLDLSFTPRVL